MASACTAPLVIPLLYDPSFKVDVRLHEPLLSDSKQNIDVDIELMSLCSQLETMCQKELLQHKNEKIEHGKVSSIFTNEATVVCDRMHQIVARSPDIDAGLGQYIIAKRFDLLFPRAAVYLSNPGHFTLTKRKEGLDNYYSELSSLHNLSSLSHQINSDLSNLADHKYIAHQMAILYQSLNNVGHPLLDPFKKSIEDNFKSIKSTLSQESNAGKQLNSEQKEWFLSLTSGIVNTINSFPKELTKEMLLPASVLKRT